MNRRNHPRPGITNRLESRPRLSKRNQTSHAPRLSAHRPGQTAYRLVIVTALWRYFRLKRNLNLPIVARGVNAVPERLYIRIDGYQRKRPSAG